MMLLGLVIHSAAAYTSNPDRSAWPFQDPRNHVGFDLLADLDPHLPDAGLLRDGGLLRGTALRTRRRPRFRSQPDATSPAAVARVLAGDHAARRARASCSPCGVSMHRRRARTCCALPSCEHRSSDTSGSSTTSSSSTPLQPCCMPHRAEDLTVASARRCIGALRRRCDAHVGCRHPRDRNDTAAAAGR